MISCIWSLSENHCHFPIEIIAVNNNSTDKTEEVLKSLGVTYYNETKKGPGYARQCGLDHAKGKYHICIDADTLYPPHYIETHVKYLMNPKVACTFSLWSFMVDERHSRFGLWCYEGLEFPKAAQEAQMMEEAIEAAKGAEVTVNNAKQKSSVS